MHDLNIIRFLKVVYFVLSTFRLLRRVFPIVLAFSIDQLDRNDVLMEEDDLDRTHQLTELIFHKQICVVTFFNIS